MAEIVDPEVREDNYKRKILLQMVLVLDSSVLGGPACKAEDPGSRPGPG